MGQEYRHQKTSLFLLNYHFVWIPKWRRKVLSGKVDERLKSLIIQKALELESLVIALEVMPDHVHLFLNSPPSLAPNEIMHRIKGYTSRMLRKEFFHLRRLPTLWTRSYFVSSAENVASETIQKYIADQKKD